MSVVFRQMPKTSKTSIELVGIGIIGVIGIFDVWLEKDAGMFRVRSELFTRLIDFIVACGIGRDVDYDVFGV